jgi:hypothetical protein
MRNGLVVLALSLAGIATAAAAYLNDPSEASAPPALGASSQGPAHDPGDSMTRSLARRENISMDEAARRLRIMSQADRFRRALAQRYPEHFVALAFAPKPSFRLVAYFAKVDVRTIEDEVRSLAENAELRGAIAVEGTPYSLAERAARAERIRTIVKSVDPRAGIATPLADGDVKITVENPVDFKARLRRSSPAVRDALRGIVIEQFSGVKPV